MAMGFFEPPNTLRPHQSLGYATPDLVYRTGRGGGACIVDKYPKADRKVAKEVVGQRQSAANEDTSTSLN
ncbi:hypothetical protein Acaty_m0055 (plasmid) [Acidithiobacillus caldus ATCC 51756]|uniref:Integrase catalytic domain-containing protein n=1 Tax=Acidithiobacillus caldus (strain ATCC 51756 / DSM 8584 / KU) TaxID=637389 RepID=A0A059ZYU7_ACICK|nr:hypothetical protein Acaty_m0055 [Acidithiobacillus caldus ATCC 51756]